MKSPEPNARNPADLEHANYEQHRLFDALDGEGTGIIKKKLFLHQFSEAGIPISDKRLKEVRQRLGAVRGESLSREDFCNIIAPNPELVKKVITRQLVIPEWTKFKKNIKELYESVKKMKGGENATYIPELARQDPNLFSVCFCSKDGQQLSFGDSETRYSVQSSSKPIALLVALQELGEENVHRFVGREPSGRNFNELCLNRENIPHNPMINAGAIMTCSLIKSREKQSVRFRHLMKYWKAMVGDELAVTFSNTTYLSERASADRNFCLAYMMQEAGAFQSGRRKDLKPREWDSYDLVKNLELYFSSCSIEINPRSHSILAATLATGGVCPLTGVRVFDANNVRNALSLMLSCGMYDYSGEWAYSIGLPAKSGVSGCLIVVVPNVGGFCIFSPPLDDVGNSFKGIEFSKLLVKRFTFHYYDMVNSHVSIKSSKYNPCKVTSTTRQSDLLSLCFACAKGDFPTVKSVLSCGAEINRGDYDGRTPMHLAASEGQYQIVKYLVTKGANLDPLDRWGNTPHMDAVREGHKKIATYLSSRITRRKVIRGSLRKPSILTGQTIG